MAEKRTSTKALRALPEADIRTQLDGLRKEYWQNRLKVKDGSQQKTHEISAVKRQIARIQTLLTEKKASTHA